MSWVRLLKPALCACLLVAPTACGPAATNSPASQGDPLASADEDMLFREGQAYAAAGDFTRAEQYLQAAIARGYSLQEALPLLIDVCVRSNRYGLALQHALPELARDPGNWRLRFVVATLYGALGKDIQAESELRRVTMDEPEAEDAHYALGKLLWDRSERDESKERLVRYLELAPDGAHAVEARAMLREDSVAESAPRSPRTHVSEPLSPQGLDTARPTRVEEIPE